MNEVEQYIKNETWLVKENANSGFSFSGLMSYLGENGIKKHMLENVYPNKISESHKKGYFHIHDLGFGIIGYCSGWPLRQLLEEGFGGLYGKIQAGPAKHFGAALGQMVNFLGTLQMEFAGAQAFSSFDTYLAPYVAKDKLSYNQVKQEMQEFIFGLNVPSRFANQAPFTNMTFDWVCPQDLKNIHPKIGGVPIEETYSDFQKEMDMINKAFLEVMIQGDYMGRIFTFPIPTYNLTKDFIWDNQNAQLLFEMTAKYGTPYFQNYIGSGLNPGDIRSMCCRLNIDKRELRSRGNGLFGAGEQTGSVGVVTINMPKLAYEVNAEIKEPINPGDRQKLLKIKIDKYMNYAKESLELKRRIVIENMKNNLMPYTKRYLSTWDTYFSTIGAIGLNEMCLNLIGEDILSDNGIELSQEILEHMRKNMSDFQEETGNLYNLEATPAEGTTYRLAQLDKKQYPDIITAGTEDAPYYTNSCHVPVDNNLNIMELTQHQEKLQPLFTGGTVVHYFLGERVSDWINAMFLVRKIAENSKLPYFSITPTFSICPVHGYISGEHNFCPLDHSEDDMKKFGIIKHREEE